MTRQLLLTTVVSAGTNVVLSIALIPRFDLVGASVAWTISRALYPASGLFGLWVAHRITPFRWSLLAPTGLALAIGGPTFWALSRMALPVWTVYPLFFVGAGIFLLAVLATRSIEEGDMVAFHHAERTIGRSFPRLGRLLERGRSADGEIFGSPRVP